MVDISSSTRVPVLPAAHAQAVSLVMSKDANIAELAAVIGSDPAMTLGVLNLANSAMSSPVERATRVGDAMVRIGLEDTRRVVLGIIMGDSASDDLRYSGLEVGELWRHLVATALLADGVASTDDGLRDIRPQAFSAGLLHDVGRLVMASAAPQHYQRVVRRVAKGATPLQAERAEFGTDHAALGAEVALEWGLPDQVAAAVGAHHEQHDPLSDAIHRGRLLASKLGVGDGLVDAGPPALDGDDADALAVMHLGGTQQVLARIEWFRGALPR